MEYLFPHLWQSVYSIIYIIICVHIYIYIIQISLEISWSTGIATKIHPGFLGDVSLSAVCCWFSVKKKKPPGRHHPLCSKTWGTPAASLLAKRLGVEPQAESILVETPGKSRSIRTGGKTNSALKKKTGILLDRFLKTRYQECQTACSSKLGGVVIPFWEAQMYILIVKYSNNHCFWAPHFGARKVRYLHHRHKKAQNPKLEYHTQIYH